MYKDAIIVLFHKAIMVFTRFPHKSVKNNHEQATIHAEQNAVIDCSKEAFLVINHCIYNTLSLFKLYKILCTGEKYTILMIINDSYVNMFSELTNVQ